MGQVEVNFLSQIFKLETQYIEQANPRGNALKGMIVAHVLYQRGIN